MRDRQRVGPDPQRRGVRPAPAALPQHHGRHRLRRLDEGFREAPQQGLRDQGLRADDRRPDRRPAPRTSADSVAKTIADKHHNHLPCGRRRRSPRRHGHRGPTRSPRSSTPSHGAGARPDRSRRGAGQLRPAEGRRWRGSRALRGGQGGRLRSRRRRLRLRGAGRRRDQAGGGDRRRGGADRPPLPARPAADDGSADAPRTSTYALLRLGARRLAGGLPARCSPTAPGPRAARPGFTSSTTAAWVASAPRDPAEVLALARACAEDPHLDLAGVWTHFATADEPDSEFFDQQLDRFAAVAAAVRAEFPGSHRPRRQQRRRLPRPALALRHGPLRRRPLRARPLPGRPGRSAASPRRSRCAPMSPT